MAAIVALGEDGLKQYISKLGDRLVTVKFCKNGGNPGNNTRRLSLVDRIKMSQMESVNNHSKLNNNNLPGPTTNTPSSKRHAPNEKPTRIISIGWIMNGTPVRERNGGGARSVSINKKAKKPDILQRALDLFFPNGVSLKKHGPLSKYTYDLLDYKEHVLNEEYTVAQLYKMTGLSMLRFYLATNKLDNYVSSDEGKEEKLKRKTKRRKGEKTAKTVEKSQDNECSEQQIGQTHNESYWNECTIIENITNDCIMEEFLSYPDNETENSHNVLQMSGQFEYSIPIENHVFDISESLAASKTVVVHRGQIFIELTSEFESIDNLQTLINIEIIGTNGKRELAYDGGGVLKDALTEYWLEFYETVCEGTIYKIPQINHTYTKSKWKAIAKILLLGYNQVKYFPVALAKPFVEYALYGNISFDIVEAYLLAISSLDAEVLRKAMANFDDVEYESVIDTLTNLECRQMATKSNITRIVEELAHTFIIQKPMFILDCWMEVLRNKISKNTLKTVYETCNVSNKSVLDIIQTTDSNLTADKEKTLSFLKRFIREAKNDVLEFFLRFCTGANIITCQSIQIEFNQLVGGLRRPTSHTCNNLLVLPVGYDSYGSFKLEFNNVLKSGYWSMDIV